MTGSRPKQSIFLESDSPQLAADDNRHYSYSQISHQLREAFIPLDLEPGGQ